MKIKPPLRAESLESLGPDLVTAHPHAVRQPHSALNLKRILVPIDFSGASLQALDYALALAEQFHGRVILLHVVEPAVHPDNYLLAPALDETNSRLLEDAREQLLTFGRKRVGHRVPSESLVRMGHAVSEISDTAKAVGADLIVLGAQGSGPQKPAGLGSTAERVVHHAHCPVLTVRPSSGASAG